MNGRQVQVLARAETRRCNEPRHAETKDGEMMKQRGRDLSHHIHGYYDGGSTHHMILTAWRWTIA